MPYCSKCQYKVDWEPHKEHPSIALCSNCGALLGSVADFASSGAVLNAQEGTPLFPGDEDPSSFAANLMQGDDGVEARMQEACEDERPYPDQNDPDYSGTHGEDESEEDDMQRATVNASKVSQASRKRKTSSANADTGAPQRRKPGPKAGLPNKDIMSILPHVTGPFQTHFLEKFLWAQNSLEGRCEDDWVYKRDSKAMEAVIDEVLVSCREQVCFPIPILTGLPAPGCVWLRYSVLVSSYTAQITCIAESPQAVLAHVPRHANAAPIPLLQNVSVPPTLPTKAKAWLEWWRRIPAYLKALQDGKSGQTPGEWDKGKPGACLLWCGAVPAVQCRCPTPVWDLFGRSRAHSGHRLPAIVGETSRLDAMGAASVRCSLNCLCTTLYPPSTLQATRPCGTCAPGLRWMWSLQCKS